MKIALLGDIAFFGKFSLKNNSNLEEYFKDASSLLNGYDLVVGNLETPFVDEGKTYGFKSAYLKSDVANISLLKYLNIGIVNLANNHIYDYGKANYELTKKLLKENEIRYFGVENIQVIHNFKDNKIAFNGYCCYSTNPLGINSAKRDGINELHLPTIENILKTNADANLFNILSFHVGQEHINYPNYDHIEMARKLALISPYVYYGHHPHVAQGIEKVNKSLIAYSLGNFCFDDVYTKKSKLPLIKQSKNNKESFILELEVENNKLVNFEVIPIYLGTKKMTIHSEKIKNNIDSYSKTLSKNKVDYIFFRRNLINTYIASRKKIRNLNWYLKRLNYKSLFMIIASKKNAKKYLTAFKNYL